MTRRRRHRRSATDSGLTAGQALATGRTAEAEDTASPAQRFAAARRRQREASSELARFTAGLPFALDGFQTEACRALEAGHGVLVAAPTGAGKTVVGEFAVHLGLARGLKTFYTTPIKALSNQKYTDLVAAHGAERVGLLTGDSSVNPGADVVVMTTEVLRNMLYSRSAQLDRLGYVVMDEVHYLADRFRGPVWEEVIIHLPAQVRLVSLSATVSNAEELGAWLGEVRADSGGCEVIVSEHRPVPLTQHMMVGRRLLDLYALDERSGEAEPGGAVSRTAGRESGTLPAPGPLNPDLVHLYRRAQRASSAPHAGGTGRHRPHGRSHRTSRVGRAAAGTRHGAGLRAPSRTSVVCALERRGLLPAIVFVFSRAGCDQAVAQLLVSDTVLTTQEEADRIREIIDARTAQVPRADLAALGFHQWAQTLERGFAAHHAGLLPLFKEVVEELFSAGLVKVVYATETLALGINMPARTVVLESLRKWNGAGHVQLTPGEYTQLTGRAGRRGIDTVGHAVVLATDEADPDTVASLASRRSYPLVSAFRPTYNMAVNLLSRATRARAREILESSFAQYQADRSVVELAGQVRRAQARERQLADQLTCHLGDLREYMDLRERVSQAESELARLRRGVRRERAGAAMTALRRGDVVLVRTGRRRRHGVVLATGTDRAGQVSVTLLTEDGRVREVTATTHPEGVTGVGRLTVAASVDVRRPRDRDRLTGRLVEAVRTGTLVRTSRSATSREESEADAGTRSRTRVDTTVQTLEAARAALRAHPCHGCPDVDAHAQAGRRWLRARAEAERLAERMSVRTGTIARQLDAVCQVLLALGYLEPVDRGHPERELRVTPAGRVLARVYAERDLLVAECVRQGVWEDLDADDLAGAVSACVYEARSTRAAGSSRHVARPAAGPAPLDAVSPSSPLRAALRQQTQVAARIHREETLARTAVSPGEDDGIAAVMAAWARGASLAQVLDDGELSAGDFVRTARMELDLLGQLARLDGEHTGLARAAAQASVDIGHGVVAWSSVA